VSDGDLTDTATVSVTVTPVNDAPVANDDAYSTAEDTALSIVAPGVLFNDSDVDGDSLSAALGTAPGHGTLSLTDAIRYSCNVYFYNVGRRMGIDRISHYAKLLAIGQRTGIDLPGEKEGLVPSQEWSRNTRKSDWYPGETISVSIGQGPLVVTPLQIAVHTALIANRGHGIVPHLLEPSVSGQGQPSATAANSRAAEEIGVKVFDTVIRGMWKSVNEGGTGRGAKVDGFDVCGKTGSTQLIGRERAQRLGKVIKTHSWFTGFAPRDNPQVAVTVLVEFGGMGGATAAPLARELFSLFKEKHD